MQKDWLWRICVKEELYDFSPNLVECGKYHTEAWPIINRPLSPHDGLTFMMY